MLADNISNENYIKFENLYNTYASKVYGFLNRYTECKEQKDLLMEEIFYRVWKDINSFGVDTEKRLLSIVLFMCRRVLKSSEMNPVS